MWQHLARLACLLLPVAVHAGELKQHGFRERTEPRQGVLLAQAASTPPVRSHDTDSGRAVPGGGPDGPGVVPPPINFGRPGPPPPPPPASLPPFVPKQILLVVPLTSADDETSALRQRFELRVEDQAALESLGKLALLLSWSNKQDPVELTRQFDGELRRQFGGEPPVSWAQLNWLYKPLTQASAASAGSDYASEMLNVEALRGLASGQDVLVALVDTPVHQSHPEFAHADIVNNLDVTGKDGGTDIHGTAVASPIVAASQLSGLAPKAKLLVLGALMEHEKNLTAAQSFFMAKALDIAIKNCAQVINIAVATASKEDELINQLIDTAVQDGAVVVAANGEAGRNKRKSYPAALPNVIAVNAVDRDRRLFSRASTGSYISLAAPGVDVRVACPPDKYCANNGSSIASGYVSAIAALILEKRSDLDAQGVRVLLERTAINLGDKEEYGKGLVNGVEALREALAGR